MTLLRLDLFRSWQPRDFHGEDPWRRPQGSGQRRIGLSKPNRLDRLSSFQFIALMNRVCSFAENFIAFGTCATVQAFQNHPVYLL
ncbi:MAG: hypothetical protein ACRYGK_08150, partial [Janthinobacterium lividum]